MTDRKHTPLPWEVCNVTDIFPVGDKEARKHIADIDIANAPVGCTAKHTDLTYTESRANAAFIVRACNMHYELVEALEAACRTIHILECQRNKVLGKVTCVCECANARAILARARSGQEVE